MKDHSGTKHHGSVVTNFNVKLFRQQGALSVEREGTQHGTYRHHASLARQFSDLDGASVVADNTTDTH